MDKKKMALIAAGIVGAGALAVSMAALAIGASGIPVTGSSYGCCCCCSSSYFVPVLGLLGIAVAAKRF